MYATRDDLVARFCVNEVENLEAMQTSPNAVEQALQDASEEIDSFVGVKYQLPLPNKPSTLVRVACNIVRYRLYYAQPTEEVEKRFDDEMKYLSALASGKAILSVLNSQNEVTQEKINKSPATMPVGTTYRGGVFGDDVLNRMPSIDTYKW